MTTIDQIPEEEMQSALQMSKKGYKTDGIIDYLIKKGINKEHIELIIHRVNDDKKRNKGLFNIACGITCLIISFILTVFLFHSDQSINTVMYASTTLGTGLVVWGLYDIMS